MKWVKPKNGDERHRMFFALLPVRVRDEVRWLETVKVREVYEEFIQPLGWRAVEFE